MGIIKKYAEYRFYRKGGIMHENKTGSQLFYEMDCHLFDPRPSLYFNEMKAHVCFAGYPFSLLADLESVKQSPRFHPEGNVWNHTMMVIDEAAKQKYKSRNQRVFVWAALLHDIGKKDATRNKNGKITAYEHDRIGAEQGRAFLQEFTEDKEFIGNVAALIKWHMQILYVVKSMKFADIQSMGKEVDIREVALLGYCDRMGRLGADKQKERETIAQFMQQCGLRPLDL